jgi:protease-4
MGRTIIDQIEDWTDKSSIKALVIHIDSPGGGAAVSHEIYETLLAAREEKPVVAAMTSVAASGGYYIACAADRIVANPGTITGSIGVIMQFYTAGDLMDKIGVDMETIKSGEFKDVGSLNREMTEKEELMLRSVVMDAYEQFVEVVATGRNMEPQQVRELADGAIFTGHQAYNFGLVDTLGGLNDAVDLAADLAGLEGEPQVVRPYHRKKLGFMDLLGSFLGRVEHHLGAGSTGPQLLYLYQ